LGLSISKSFVEMMGGKILVDSEYEQGSVFMVIIPAVAGSKAKVKLKKDLPEGHAFYAPAANVLVVDDNEFNMRVAQGLLGLFKIDVQTAFSGKEAITLVQKNEYDIVFMDHMMPEMDGVEATGEIRKLGGKYKQLPIMALTANAVQGAKEMFLSSGFDGFISKPIDLQEMYGILKEWLPPEKIELRTDDVPEKTSGGFFDALNKVGEINTEIGLSRVSGMEKMYRETLELFDKKLVMECDAMSAKIHSGDIKSFSIAVHAMKSALSTIGAMGLSETASKLETASKDNDIEYCTERFPAFKDKLLNLHEELSGVFQGGGAVAGKEFYHGGHVEPSVRVSRSKAAGDRAYLQEQIKKTLSAASDFDGDAGLKVIDDLLNYDFGEQSNAVLENAASAFKDFNFDAVTELLNGLKEG
jgi:CheY-like chemotaxis protein